MKIAILGNDEVFNKFCLKLFKGNFSSTKIEVFSEVKEFMQFFSINSLAVGIVDVEDKSFTPDDVIKLFLRNYGSLPLVFSGSIAVLKTRISQDLYSQSEFFHILQKPLDPQEFVSCMDFCLERLKELEEEMNTVEESLDKFFPLKVKNFFLHGSFPYDVYMSLSETKQIKVLNANEEFTHSKISGYIKKGVKFLYLRKDDQITYFRETLGKIYKLLKSRPTKSKLFFPQSSAIGIIHEYIACLGVSEEVIQLTNEVIETAIWNSNYYKNLKELLKDYKFITESIPEKSLLTFYIALAILKELRWSARPMKLKLGLASILHDSMVENDKLAQISSLESEDFKSLNENEQERYLSHIQKVVSVIGQFSGYSDVEFLISEHHELPDGSGFPSKKNAMSIGKLSSVLIVSHKFAEFMTWKYRSSKDKQGDIKDFYAYFDKGHFKEPLKGLKKSMMM